MKLLVGKKYVATFLILTMFLSTIVSLLSYNSQNTEAATTADSVFETEIAGFPESYKVYLRILHKEHPNWTFEAVQVNLKDWDYIIKKELNPASNVVPFSETLTTKTVLYMLNNTSAYYIPSSWYTGNGGLDNGNWAQASQAFIEYCMDPRNFLNDSYIFQFEDLRYNDSLKTNYYSVLKLLLDNTFMDCDYAVVGGTSNKTYADVFIEAGEKNNVSPIMLASRVIQEQGGGSLQSNGKYILEDGKTGAGGKIDGITYYNFFNIGACGAKDEIFSNAMKEAKSYGWTSQYLSILGGANRVASEYVSIGQNTVYFQKFNVSVCNASGTDYLYNNHQYMTNILAPINEGYRSMNTYYNSNVIDGEFNFRIPVYKNMPDIEDTSMPTTGLDTGLFLKGLTVTSTDGNTTYSFEQQSFNKLTKQYNVVVPSGVTTIKITGTKNVSTSTITGNGTYTLSSGINRIPIKVKSTTGRFWTYFLNIYVEPTATVKDINYLSTMSISSGTLTPTFSKTTLNYTASVANSVSSINFNIVPATNAWPTIYYKDRTDANKHADVTSITQNLAVGKNVFYVDVTSANGGVRTYTVTITRAAATTTPTEEETTTAVEKLSYTSTKYNIVTSGKYVNGFAVGTTVKTAQSNFSIKNGTIKVTDSSGNAKGNNEVLTTGDKIVINGTNVSETVTLNVIIYGDINGDGNIDVLDCGIMTKAVWGGGTLSGIKKLAADVKSGDDIDVLDVGNIAKYIWGGGNITQKR